MQEYLAFIPTNKLEHLIAKYPKEQKCGGW